ncbi:MAG: hypothetical protein QF752_07530 [Planctomycetota bacterium]|jgi:hypothetical protein|nr:hypothetical protein [Planctomycetota bacterium]
MGDWLDFGPFNDDDEFDEDGELAEGIEAVEEEPFAIHRFTCGQCEARYNGSYESIVSRTVVDLSQRFPQFDFSAIRIMMMTIRHEGRLIGFEEACLRCWTRGIWSRVQKSYGYRRPA